ncbi:MAG: hypothetical protein JWO51_296 [Rhodospirillales bacterium]|nr:hypothetical protein [Rhodospirillales bacterium]
MQADLPASAAIYNPFVLALYDLWVTRLSTASPGAVQRRSAIMIHKS